jgi:hypothetical protein
MTEAKKPSPPRGLSRRGRSLWRQLHADLEYDPHETEVVLEACRTADAIDELHAVIARDGYTIAGSTGQTVVHPAVAELRQQQASLSRLLAGLNLSAAFEGEAGGVAQARTISAQAAAASNARWAKSRKARSA